MGLSFLAPLFLAGLAAVAIPILVHLRRRRERTEVPFPSVRFLRDAPVRTEQRRRLRHPGLLALRIAALGLLAAAFARPFVDGDGEATAGAASPREVVLLLDRSWSMSAPGRWGEAVEAVERWADGLGPRDRMSLVLFDRTAHAPVRSTDDAGRLRRALADAAPGDAGTRLAPALRLAGSLLEASGPANRVVVLVSDFGAGLGDEEVELPPGTEVRTEAVGGEPPGGVAVLDAAAAEGAAPGAGGVRVRARLLARAPPAGSTEVVLEAGGRERRRVDLTPGTPSEVTFGPVPAPDGPVPVSVRVAGDRLEADDAFHLVIDGGRAVPVRVLERPGRGDASLYVQRALELSRDPPLRVDVRAPERIGSDVLEGQRVVILNDRPLPRGREARALRAFVEAGGGLLVATGPGTVSDGDAAGSFLPVRLGPVAEREREGGARLASMERSHPVFEPFREPGSASLAAARFLRSRRLEPVDSARVLARFDDGSPALVEGRAGRGRILVWASTLDTYWSDLPVQPAFLPFVHRAVLHLASLREAPASYLVGDALDPEGLRRGSMDEEPATASGAAGASTPGFAALRTPDGTEIALGAGDDGPVLLERAGIHVLVGDDGVSVPVAVNAPRDEALEAVADPEELAAAVTSPETRTAGANAPAATPRDRERSQGLWRYLLAGALLLLAVETVLSNRLSGARLGSTT